MITADHEYHGVIVDHLPKDVNVWLETKLGAKGDRWFIKNNFNETTVYFKNQRDHTLFLLTWGK